MTRCADALDVMTDALATPPNGDATPTPAMETLAERWRPLLAPTLRSCMASWTALDRTTESNTRRANAQRWVQAWDRLWTTLSRRFEDDDNLREAFQNIVFGYSMYAFGALDTPADPNTPPLNDQDLRSEALPERRIAAHLDAIARAIPNTPADDPQQAIDSLRSALHTHAPPLAQALGEWLALIYSFDNNDTGMQLRFEASSALIGPPLKRVLDAWSRLERVIIADANAQTYFRERLDHLTLSTPTVDVILDDMRAASADAATVQNNLQSIANALSERRSIPIADPMICSAGGRTDGVDVSPDETDWGTSPWREMGVRMTAPHRFRYCYHAPNRRRFALLAEGASDDADMLNLRYCIRGRRLRGGGYDLTELTRLTPEQLCLAR